MANGENMDGKDNSGLGVIPPEVLEREMAMCRNLQRENGGRCNWGECAQCGVVPLLVKLGEGRLLEEAEDIERRKREVFGP
jgi:hypothetical protein